MKRWNFLEEADDAIVILNEDGKILFSNKFFDEMFGYNDNFLENKYIQEIMPACSGVTTEVIFGNGIKKNGDEFKVRISLSKINLKRRVVYFGIANNAADEDDLVPMEHILDSLNRSLDRVSSLMSLPIKKH